MPRSWGVGGGLRWCRVSVEWLYDQGLCFLLVPKAELGLMKSCAPPSKAAHTVGEELRIVRRLANDPTTLSQGSTGPESAPGVVTLAELWELLPASVSLS